MTKRNVRNDNVILWAQQHITQINILVFNKKYLPIRQRAANAHEEYEPMSAFILCRVNNVLRIMTNKRTSTKVDLFYKKKNNYVQTLTHTKC